MARNHHSSRLGADEDVLTVDSGIIAGKRTLNTFPSFHVHLPAVPSATIWKSTNLGRIITL